MSCGTSAGPPSAVVLAYYNCDWSVEFMWNILSLSPIHTPPPPQPNSLLPWSANTDPPTIQSPDQVSQQPDRAMEQSDVVPSIEKEIHDATREQSSPPVDINENVDHEMPDLRRCHGATSLPSCGTSPGPPPLSRRSIPPPLSPPPSPSPSPPHSRR